LLLQYIIGDKMRAFEKKQNPVNFGNSDLEYKRGDISDRIVKTN